MRISDIQSISTATIEAIVSRTEIQALINNNVDMSNLVLISISEPVKEFAINEQLTDKDVEHFKQSLRVKFYDVAEDFCDFTVIPDSTAKEIQDFILKNINERFIINCRAGKSRSAGVGRAIECLKFFGIGDEAKYNYKTGFDSEIVKHSRYYPNLTVFDKIVKQY